MSKLTTLLIFILLSSTSFGFGTKAHQVISLIAQNHLSDQAKLAIIDILQGESLPSASTWADKMRYSNGDSKFWSYSYSSNWHFVNIEANKSYALSRKNPRGDAYIALLAFISILKNQEAENGVIKDGLQLYQKEIRVRDKEMATRQLALKFLIHIVGDLHQPLHVGYEKDQGGNKIDVRWMNRKTNLHSVWDTRLVNYQNLSVEEFEQKLMSKVSAMEPAELSRIQQSEPMDWINEGLLIRDEIYDIERYQGRFSENYAEDFTPLMDAQLIKAGLRLAATLNRIFE